MADYILGKDLTDDDITAWAREAHKYHQQQKTFDRVLNPDYLILGKLGERQYSIISGLPMNMSISKWGDGGVDFTASNGREIDVKTVRINPKPTLYREQNKRHCEILVLAWASARTMSAFLLGWTTDEHIVEHGVLEVSPVEGQTHWNHTLARSQLWSMDEHWEELL